MNHGLPGVRLCQAEATVNSEARVTGQTGKRKSSKRETRNNAGSGGQFLQRLVDENTLFFTPLLSNLWPHHENPASAGSSLPISVAATS